MPVTIKKKTDDLLNFEIKWYDDDKPMGLSSLIKKKSFKNQISKKIYVLRNYTCEPIFDLVLSQLKFSGYSLDIKFGQFDNILNDLIKLNNKNKYDAIIICIDFSKFFKFGKNKDNHKSFDKVLTLIKNNLIFASQNYYKPIIIQNVSIEKKKKFQEKKYIAKTSKFLKKISKISNVQICENLNLNKIFDKRNWDIAGLPYNNKAIKSLSSIFSSKIYENLAKPIKVIATDLDNTMWSGVAGDEKISIKSKLINFEEYHKLLVKFKKKGYLLTIVSKNNINTVRDIFRKHKFRYIKLSDFVLVKANWNPKSQNLKEVAKNLNLGEDSIVFIDDSIHERFEVSKNLNKVRIFPFIQNKFIEILKQFPELNRSKFSAEDKVKTKMYFDQFKRDKFKSITKNLSDYLNLLDQKIKLKKDSMDTFERSVQMETKINQFNMTLSRFKHNEIEKFIKDDNKSSYLFKVEDKFGDNGYVCSVLIERIQNVAHIRSFLMSCRVIERGVENNILDYVINDQFKNFNVKRIISYIKKGERNKDFLGFYKNFGMNKINSNQYMLNKSIVTKKFNKINIKK